jgi:hypothetical protein
MFMHVHQVWFVIGLSHDHGIYKSYNMLVVKPYDHVIIYVVVRIGDLYFVKLYEIDIWI